MDEAQMSKDVFTRVIVGDMNNPVVQQAARWFEGLAKESHLDPDVFRYPKTTLIQAYDKGSGKPLLYVPVHDVFMIESLGPNPDASDGEIAAALAQVVKSIHWEAYKQGLGEIYFPCTNDRTAEFASNHNFKRQFIQVRVKLDDKPEAETAERFEDRDTPFFKMKVYS
jgi:hypothetical protein